jgi:DHA1 family tetracycline resistance protein-like MFS transporter
VTRRTIAPHIFVYGMAFLAAMGGGLPAPVLPRLLQEITGTGVAQTSVSYGLLISIYAIAMLLTSKLLGRLSDAFGRRPVLLIALVGTAIDYVIAATAQSIEILLLARFIAGCCGATLVVCNAAIMDLTPPEQRSVRIGMIKGALAAGFTMGPIVGGILGAYDTRAPFWAAAIIAGLGVLYGWQAFPETLKLENRRPFLWSAAWPFSIPKLSGTSLPLGVVITMLLFEFGTSVTQPVGVLYMQLRFGWTPEQIGVFMSIGGLLAIGGQAGLTRLLVPRLGEKRATVLGLGIFAITLVLYGLTETSWQIYTVLLISQFGFIGIPAIISLVSRYASNAEQGELMGLITVVAISAQILAPLLGAWLFAEYSMRDGAIFLPGLPYFAGAFILACSLVAAAMSKLLAVPAAPIPSAQVQATQ